MKILFSPSFPIHVNYPNTSSTTPQRQVFLDFQNTTGDSVLFSGSDFKQLKKAFKKEKKQLEKQNTSKESRRASFVSATVGGVSTPLLPIVTDALPLVSTQTLLTKLLLEQGVLYGGINLNKPERVRIIPDKFMAIIKQGLEKISAKSKNEDFLMSILQNTLIITRLQEGDLNESQQNELKEALKKSNSHFLLNYINNHDHPLALNPL